MRVILLLLLSVIAAGLGYALLSLPEQASGLRDLAIIHLDASGVAHPVTAVLLNYRGYDTLLELVVLLLAVIGVWALDLPAPRRMAPSGAVLDVLARQLTPVLVLVAVYLLWVGATAPGGAFQAGAVLGAVGVLLLLAGWRPPAGLLGWPLRLALLIGTLIFVALSIWPLLLGQSLLQYPRADASWMILLIEAAATLSIGVTLVALFLATPPAAGRGGRDD